MERLFTEQETSKHTKRAVSTLQKDRCTGHGIPFVKIGRQVRYRESDIQHYIKSLPSRRSTSETAAEVKYDGGLIGQKAG